ncbi:uncharacterized protein LOC123322209 [Coccinella septempunctata]|uniref:uncharacterized protein LOC123322209 n=1 Tax=Coccinella septempunctata TaxID=41139 RepID=UPI001D06686C|nr:uncharacterized protein LOC123322209 [Coccinella septempunctata]
MSAKLEASSQILAEKERHIQAQNTIIELLKNDSRNISMKTKDSVANNDRHSSNVRNDVADIPRNSLRKGKLESEVVTNRADLHGFSKGIINGKNKQKTATIVGTTQVENSEKLSFAGAVRRAWLHIGRVQRGVSSSEIEKYLRSKFPSETFEITEIQAREGANSVSFKLGANFSLLEELTKLELWPTGITIRRFKFFRSSERQKKRPDVC